MVKYLWQIRLIKKTNNRHYPKKCVSKKGNVVKNSW